MKVIAKKVKKRTSRETVTIIEQEKVSMCCAKMLEAIDNCSVGFGNYDGFDNQNTDVNIYCLQPHECGEIFVSLMPISFCPFCGKPIEIELTG